VKATNLSRLSTYPEKLYLSWQSCTRRTDTVYSVVEICCYLTPGPMQLWADPLSLLKFVHPPREVLVKPHSIFSRIRYKTIWCSNDRVGHGNLQPPYPREISFLSFKPKGNLRQLKPNVKAWRNHQYSSAVITSLLKGSKETSPNMVTLITNWKFLNFNLQ
jgi:hypothetical protein